MPQNTRFILTRATPEMKNRMHKKERLTADIYETKGKINLEILLDRSSLEVFVNNGEKVLTTYIFPVTGGDDISAFSDGGNTLIKSIKIWNLSKVKQ